MGGVKITTEIFRERLTKKKPNLILLSECNSIKGRVTVKCKVHDYIYEVGAEGLMAARSYGCKYCAGELHVSKRNMGRGEFVRKAIEKHGERYDYSKVEYKNGQTKVNIVCKEHGDFFMLANNHLQGEICKKCADLEAGKQSRDTTESFIKKANIKHENFYNYSKVEYSNSMTPVRVICPEHGEFLVKPNTHIQGVGCPRCKGSKLEKLVSNILVKNNIPFTYEFRSNWLGKKSLDFYLSDYNIAIECQGKQHFEEREFFGGLTGFTDAVRWDIKKNQEYQENNIKLFYITDQTQFKKKMFENKIFDDAYTEENMICAGFKSVKPLKTLFIDFLIIQVIKINNK